MDENLKKYVVGDFSVQRLLRSVLLIILINYIFLLLYACFMADKAMFPAPKPSYADTAAIGKVELDDGSHISFREVRKPGHFHIIYSHGNAVDLGIIGSQVEEMAEMLGTTILCYDYPGYGTSDGSPREQSVNNSLMAVYGHLLDSGIPADRIVIWGRSVGSGPSTWLAKEKPVAGLILESPFISAFRVVTRVKILPFDRFPNIERIADVDCPVLVIHGTRDGVIPFFHGERIFAEASEPKFFLGVEGAGHNDLEWVGGTRYWNTIRDFLEYLRNSQIKQDEDERDTGTTP